MVLAGEGELADRTIVLIIALQGRQQTLKTLDLCSATEDTFTSGTRQSKKICNAQVKVSGSKQVLSRQRALKDANVIGLDP